MTYRIKFSYIFLHPESRRGLMLFITRSSNFVRNHPLNTKRENKHPLLTRTINKKGSDLFIRNIIFFSLQSQLSDIWTSKGEKILQTQIAPDRSQLSI